MYRWAERPSPSNQGENWSWVQFVSKGLGARNCHVSRLYLLLIATLAAVPK